MCVLPNTRVRPTSQPRYFNAVIARETRWSVSDFASLPDFRQQLPEPDFVHRPHGPKFDVRAVRRGASPIRLVAEAPQLSSRCITLMALARSRLFVRARCTSTSSNLARCWFPAPRSCWPARGRSLSLSSRSTSILSARRYSSHRPSLPCFADADVGRCKAASDSRSCSARPSSCAICIALMR